MPNQSGKILLVLVLILLVFGVGAYFFLPTFKKQDYTQSVHRSDYSTITDPVTFSESHIYQSQSMKFQIRKNPEFQIEEDTSFVNVFIEDKKINISRVATNYSTIEGHISYFDSKRSLETSQEQKMSTNNLKGVQRIESFQEGPIKEQKIVYLITEDGWVYTVSTSEESLYPVLDQIVQSFEYKGTLSPGEDKP